MTTVPCEWQEIAMIGIIPENGTILEFAGMTEDISSFDWQVKDVDVRNLVNGGQCTTFTAPGIESMTLKIVPTDVSISANGVAQLFNPLAAGTGWGEDIINPIVVDNSIYRRKFGIILLWATAFPATSATATAAGEAAYRVQVINAYMTDYKLDYSDKQLTAEVTFKWAPRQKDASANKREESTDGSAQLAAGITTATSF